MSGPVAVGPGVLESRARELERMAGEVAAMVPRIAACAVDARLHELTAYGLFSALPVAADLFLLCLPGTPGSLPDAAAELAPWPSPSAPPGSPTRLSTRSAGRGPS